MVVFFMSYIFFLHLCIFFLFFFFNDTATTEIYTLSLHRRSSDLAGELAGRAVVVLLLVRVCAAVGIGGNLTPRVARDRKSTRLNSSHMSISYAVFCLKKKKKQKRKYNHIQLHIHSSKN